MKRLNFLSLIVLFLSISVVSLFAQDATDLEKGVGEFRDGKFNEAISTLSKVLETNKNSRIAKTYLASSYLKLGNTKDARRVFSKISPSSKDLPQNYEKKFQIIGRKPFPHYTNEAAQNNITGDIDVAVEFRGDGTVGFTFPIK
jgi:thioredoxin-like negative regulator of GroEL